MSTINVIVSIACSDIVSGVSTSGGTGTAADPFILSIPQSQDATYISYSSNPVGYVDTQGNSVTVVDNSTVPAKLTLPNQGTVSFICNDAMNQISIEWQNFNQNDGGDPGQDELIDESDVGNNATFTVTNAGRAIENVTMTVNFAVNGNNFLLILELD
jgi:hypothetical protein